MIEDKGFDGTKFCKKQTRSAIPLTSFGSAIPRKKFNFFNVQNSIQKILTQEDVEKNLEIIYPLIGKLTEEELAAVIPNIPYEFFWGIFVEKPESNIAKIVCHIISVTSESEVFPADSFLEMVDFEFLIHAFINVICDNQLAIREMSYHIFNLAVQRDVSVRDLIFSSRIFILMDDDKIPPIAVILLHTMLISDPPMEPRHNLAVELIYTHILSCGRVNSIITILNMILNDEMPTLESFDPTNFVQTIVSRTIKFSSIPILRKCILCLEKWGMGDEFCTVLVEKIAYYYNLMMKSESTFVKKGDKKNDNKLFVLWGISLLAQEVGNLNEEQIAHVTQFFVEFISNDPAFNIQQKIAQYMCLVNNKFITSEIVIDLLCKFASSNKIGAHCIAKIVSLITMPTQPLLEYICEKCDEIEGEIEDLLTSEDEETSRVAETLLNTLAKLKQ